MQTDISEEHVAYIFRVEAELAKFFLLVSCLSYSWTLKMDATCSFETSVDFNGLHGSMSQKIKLFTSIALTASDASLLKMDAAYSSKSPLIFNGLHCVIFQKIKFFLTTVMETSDLTLLFCNWLLVFAFF
jgi:hypothetical protein